LENEETVLYFHVGANNIRSQIAVGRIGAEKTGELESFSSGVAKLNFAYEIDRQQWKYGK